MAQQFTPQIPSVCTSLDEKFLLGQKPSSLRHPVDCSDQPLLLINRQECYHDDDDDDDDDDSNQNYGHGFTGGQRWGFDKIDDIYIMVK